MSGRRGEGSFTFAGQSGSASERHQYLCDDRQLALPVGKQIGTSAAWRMGTIPHAKPMKPACLSFLLLIFGLFGLPEVSPAVTSSQTESGARWLQAELPANVSLQSADCEQLAAAVGKAALAHQPEAPAILRVALTRGVRTLRRGEGGKLPCACAKRLFSISVAAAPAQASALLDLATEFYPDCAAELAGVMRDYDRVSYDYKDRANDKNVVDGRDATGTPRGTTAVPSDPSTPTQQPSFDPGNDVQDRGDLTDRDIAGMDSGSINGFGTGDFGAVGFPGSPGFIGSFPDGGLALPPSPVTVAVNG